MQASEEIGAEEGSWSARGWEHGPFAGTRAKKHDPSQERASSEARAKRGEVPRRRKSSASVGMTTKGKEQNRRAKPHSNAVANVRQKAKPKSPAATGGADRLFVTRKPWSTVLQIKLAAKAASGRLSVRGSVRRA